jgi:hypothetical protein
MHAQYLLKQADETAVELVWERGRRIPGLDPAMWRLDFCGALICRNYHGIETYHGWEIDHVIPMDAGGSEDLGNLQPMHWENRRHKAETWPDWQCKINF